MASSEGLCHHTLVKQRSGIAPLLLRLWHPHGLLLWAPGSGAVLAGRDSLEARMRFGVASQNPEHAPDFLTDIHFQSGCLRSEPWKLTSSTHKPEANSLALWMTGPADHPTC